MTHLPVVSVLMYYDQLYVLGHYRKMRGLPDTMVNADVLAMMFAEFIPIHPNGSVRMAQEAVTISREGDKP